MRTLTTEKELLKHINLMNSLTFIFLFLLLIVFILPRSLPKIFTPVPIELLLVITIFSLMHWIDYRYFCEKYFRIYGDKK